MVNIQKFKDDPDVVSTKDFDVAVQRVYFLNEVHRSYNPRGSFLANLDESDRNAIKIGLTGTPLLGEDYNSRKLFGDYIHKYYYNASIADGYALRLIREEIATNYKIELQKALAGIEIKQGNLNKELIYAHPTFVEPMLDYIITDFEKSRSALNDASIGGMVICNSSAQAEQMFDLFNAKYAQASIQDSQYENNYPFNHLKAAQTRPSYHDRIQKNNRVTSAALILHDIGSKQERKEWVDDFKAGNNNLLSLIESSWYSNNNVPEHTVTVFRLIACEYIVIRRIMTNFQELELSWYLHDQSQKMNQKSQRYDWPF